MLASGENTPLGVDFTGPKQSYENEYVLHDIEINIFLVQIICNIVDKDWEICKNK